MRVLKAVVTAVVLYPPILVAAALLTSPTVYYPSLPHGILADNRNFVTLCADDSKPALVRALREAVDEWNAAINFFSIKYFWLFLLDGVRLEVTHPPCDVEVKLDSFNPEEKGYLGYTTWGSIIVSDRIGPDKLAVVLKHELVHVLGLGDARVLRRPLVAGYNPAASTTPSIAVTSYDIYALYLCRRDSCDIAVPPYLPYQSTQDMSLDLLSLSASAAISSLWWWRRGDERGQQVD